MSFDPWRQWQSFAAAFTPAAPAAAPGFAPFIDAAERFTSAARAFFDGATRDPAQAATAFGDFLREQFQAIQMPWAAAPGAGAAMPGAPPDAPALGITREHQQRLQRMADAWRRIEEAHRRLQRLWSDALRDASTAFAAHLAQLKGPPDADALRKLYDAWIDCAEDAYSRVAHTEAFCGALADHVNATAAWRHEWQAGMEQWAKLADLPTRSEINTLAQRLKAVEAKLDAAAAGGREAPPAPAPPAARPARPAKPAARGAKPGSRTSRRRAPAGKRR